MKKKAVRDVFVSDNKYQRQVLYPLYISSFLILACLVYFAVILHQSSLDENFLRISETSQFAAVITKDNMMALVMAISLLLIFVIGWSDHMTNKILGPYERVVAEMDELLADIEEKKAPKKLKVRPGDEMFAALIKRINKLIRLKT